MSYSNNILDLPTDKSIPTHEELDLIESFFEHKDVETDRNVKLLIVFIIFMIIFSIKDVDIAIQRFGLFKTNNTGIFIVKLLIASALFFAALKYFK